ncbi:META domain-containing protein [Lacibacter sp.]|uniref:META domain-containing protein n=1 Tax=Lacibacter sp. TaxID=1915409 RepID=UPI002B4ADA21|nr:META domain-containing protein [Lacibacter sp.]HLP35615.1 META domain-containing protein [Lacibacter sp.]
MKSVFATILLLLVFVSCSPKLSPDHNWDQKRWTLYELKTVPVQLSGTEKDANLMFVPSQKQISGTGGCNRLTGTYELKKGGDIKFSNITTTRMMCTDQAFEDRFLEVLNQVDGYAVENNIMLLKTGKEVVMRLR